MDRESLERFLAAGLSLEEIGRRVGRDHSTIGYWVKKHGLQAVHREKYAPKGAVPVEVLGRLVAEGASVTAMARVLGVSTSTIRYWLKGHGLSTAQSRRNAAYREARTAGMRLVEMDCDRHGPTQFRLDTNGRYRCLRCSSAAVARRRRRVKQILVTEAGGACVGCGYDRYHGAPHFHHLDQGQKALSLSHEGVTRSLEKAREEAGKCLLLCGNCHAEAEAGLLTLPCTEARLGTERVPDIESMILGPG